MTSILYTLRICRFASDRLDNTHQHNSNPNVHIVNNETLCTTEQVEYENVEDESIYENSVCENSVCEENVGAENGTEETITEENATKENDFDENVSQGNVVEEDVCQVDHVSDENVLEEKTFEGTFVDDNVDDTNVYGTTATEPQVEEGGYENLVNDDIIADPNEPASQIEHVDESDVETERSSINDSDATPLQSTLVIESRSFEFLTFLFFNLN